MIDTLLTAFDIIVIGLASVLVVVCLLAAIAGFMKSLYTYEEPEEVHDYHVHVATVLEDSRDCRRAVADCVRRARSEED